MLYKNYAKMTEKEKQEAINHLYIDKQLSLGHIADTLGTYSNKIRRDAIKYKIPLRDKSLAQKTALNSGRHKHPTKGKVRDSDTKNKIGLGVMKNWESLPDQEKEKRQEKARQNWHNLSEDTKESILKSANNGVRIASKIGSKLERFLLKKLIGMGIKVDFHKEQLLSNTKLQIDLFLPTMNIAIEVDGPSHFKEVWGTDTLKKNVKYDNKKTGLILGKGLVLIRIRQEMDYSESRANIVFDRLIAEVEKINHKFPDPGFREIKIGDI